MAVYVTIYVLLPKFLVERQYIKFILGYGGLILFSAILQRIFIHFFYESLILNNPSEELFSFKMLLRAMILINTTVFLILSFKIFQLFQIEKRKNEVETAMYIELKADRRFYRINTNEILFIQGKGNYTTYHLQGGSKITTYGTIKKALEELPANFIRIHKSYIANKAEIRSFDTNSIEIKDQFIPRGKSITDEELL
ncbi:LytTR family transcriptional regulator DNA-binding domain-containing protein [Winogradskyella sp. 3972H.M.0a.05]|uniref:LytR/AlgR family response regulator transcription factor n=1 Tax=Winogradskyella sp. 3972H.M.0a.05 TaxID=2950277 RepID=UPI003399675D